MQSMGASVQSLVVADAWMASCNEFDCPVLWQKAKRALSYHLYGTAQPYLSEVLRIAIQAILMNKSDMDMSEGDDSDKINFDDRHFTESECDTLHQQLFGNFLLTQCFQGSKFYNKLNERINAGALIIDVLLIQYSSDNRNDFNALELELFEYYIGTLEKGLEFKWNGLVEALKSFLRFVPMESHQLQAIRSALPTMEARKQWTQCLEREVKSDTLFEQAVERTANDCIML